LDKLRRITSELNIEKNVFFKGSIDKNTKNFYMKNCDVFCVSPRTESFGIVYLEAMAYGKAIITTNVGGVAEVLSDCAVLVPPNNPNLLARGLIEVLDNREKARKLGTKALNRVKTFDWDIIVEKYKQLYIKFMDMN
jgi:glycosyltransferase involved in cell wall biosynthesis